MQTAFIFPGQGSQYPGIGSDLYQALAPVRDTYQAASDTLGYDIANLSFNDPQGEINLTRFTQPVLLTHSIACLRALATVADGLPHATIMAGHSLGEYSALVAAGVLDFEQALKLVKIRGQLMGELGAGEMEALPLELKEASRLAERHYCAVAACNLPDQTVVGGLDQDLSSLVQSMQDEYPRKRSTRLKTEGAFHTYYMVEAALRYREALTQAVFNNSKVSVMSNYSGVPHPSGADAIRSGLFMQLFNPVLWHRNLLEIVNHDTSRLIEFGGGIGAGKTAAEKRPNLEGIVKKTFRRAENPPQYHAVINVETLEKTAAELSN